MKTVPGNRDTNTEALTAKCASDYYICGVSTNHDKKESLQT